MATVASPVTQSSSPAAKPQFPFLDLKAQHARIRSEVMDAVSRVMDSQHFILGPEVDALEKEIAKFLNVNYAIGCASGSDALLLALMALGVGEGDEVITTPFTFGATGGAIARLGAKPVFVDIDPVTYNIDPTRVEAAITPRTKAIMPVHLFGLSAEMGKLREIADRHKLPVIEDAAQAIGSQYHGTAIGGLGTIGCFSFFPSKNLGCAGDGGLMTTNDKAVAERLKILRVHGCRTKYQYEVIGANSRLDAMQAAILRVKLPHLPAWTQERQRNASRYERLFQEAGLTKHVGLPTTPVDCVHVYNQYVIRVEQRDALRESLRQDGIPTEIYYPHSLHTEPAYSHLGYREGDFPQSEAAARQTLALPIFSELTEEQQRSVVASIGNFYQRGASSAA